MSQHSAQELAGCKESTEALCGEEVTGAPGEKELHHAVYENFSFQTSLANPRQHQRVNKRLGVVGSGTIQPTQHGLGTANMGAQSPVWSREGMDQVAVMSSTPLLRPQFSCAKDADRPTDHSRASRILSNQILQAA